MLLLLLLLLIAAIDQLDMSSIDDGSYTYNTHHQYSSTALCSYLESDRYTNIGTTCAHTHSKHTKALASGLVTSITPRYLQQPTCEVYYRHLKSLFREYKCSRVSMLMAACTTIDNHECKGKSSLERRSRVRTKAVTDDGLTCCIIKRAVLHA